MDRTDNAVLNGNVEIKLFLSNAWIVTVAFFICGPNGNYSSVVHLRNYGGDRDSYNDTSWMIIIAI